MDVSMSLSFVASSTPRESIDTHLQSILLTLMISASGEFPIPKWRRMQLETLEVTRIVLENSARQAPVRERVKV